MTAKEGTEAFAPNLIDTASFIESQRHGICQILNQQYGITNFDRYTPEILISQYDERYSDIPYGVVLYPTYDPVNAFLDGKQIIQDLYQGIHKSGFGIRIFECGGKFSIAKALIGLDRRYSFKHKISFALIGGHGIVDGDTILLGGRKPSQRLDSADLTGKKMLKVRRLFEPNPTIILISCSTGATPDHTQGIGRRIHLNILGSQVIAPESPAKSEDIKLTASYGKDYRLHFDVDYGEAKTAIYKDGFKFTNGVNEGPA